MEKEHVPPPFYNEINIIKNELKECLDEQKFGYDIDIDNGVLIISLNPKSEFKDSIEIFQVCDDISKQIAKLLNINEKLNLKAKVEYTYVGTVEIVLRRL